MLGRGELSSLVLSIRRVCFDPLPLSEAAMVGDKPAILFSMVGVPPLDADDGLGRFVCIVGHIDLVLFD